ncbi:MAG: PQQ-dependent sugar dehydrogenase [Pseudomonadota bacterium]
MKRRDVLLSSISFAICGQAASALFTLAGEISVERITGGLDQPWSFGFLPDRSVLITERDGAVIRASGATKTKLSGVGDIFARGQGGLLDVLVPSDFATSRMVYFTHSKSQSDGAGTAVARARLSDDAKALEDWTVIFEIKPGSSGGRHFGSRLVEGRDGNLYITVGDRGDRPSSQDTSNENGSVLRIARDGTIPSDNPLAKTNGAQPAIWSWGHRNPQGAALDLEGRLWVAEHGAKGGDEINVIRKGANYGWPVISYGRHYSGLKIGEGTSKDGMEQPQYFWDPSIAPSGMMFYSGKQVADWRGSLFVGSLKFDYISRLSGDPLKEVEEIRIPGAERIRDIREAPDGSIWVLAAGNGSLYRMSM